MNKQTTSSDSFLKQTLTVVGIVTGVVLLIILLWYIVEVLLLTFASLLAAIFLRSLTNRLKAYLPIPDKAALTVVIVGLMGVIALSSWLLAPSVAQQIDKMLEKVPQSQEQLTSYLTQYQWGRELIAQAPSAKQMIQSTSNLIANGALSRVTGVFSTTAAVLINFVVILFVGFFFAANVQPYLDGLIKLVPPKQRDRAREVLQELGYVLEWWLIGRLFSMGIISVFTTIGLWLLGIPLALTLGLLTGLMTFVPRVGSALAIVLPTLLALTISPMMAFYVIAFYGCVQFIESYLLTPLIQERAISLPPALTILAQVLFGVLTGILGVALATPLLAASMVLVKRLYIEDVLGDDLN